MIAVTFAVAIALQTNPVQTGAQMLANRNFARLENHRIGLVTNHTAMVNGEHLIDVIHRQPNVKLTALFGPEHGLRGLADAGAKVGDSVDEKTQVPVFSLYGSTRRPSMKMLENVDILVYDIQDVGARFYTYISTLGLCMQAAAEAKIPFLVLDRPNPLGGERIGGPILKFGFESFVGQYPIPIQYGLTTGELAKMIQGERWLPGLQDLDLQVEEMSGWKREMLWPDTGLPWIKPSPNIPDFETALLYPGTCLFEALNASEGRGTYEPFRTLGAKFIDSGKLVESLEQANLKGVKFKPLEFAPASIEGMSSKPRFENKNLSGVQIEVTDAAEVDSISVGVHLVSAFLEQTKGLNRATFINKSWMGKLAGTDEFAAGLIAGKTPDEILQSWQPGLAKFKLLSKKYLIYGN
ncbi:MAG: DUF1343 domain-containing protein [Fimbriimonadaceae bacterium]|nr:MAG: DUF1343 domain-containing protein [Fimbriimonadaceae bacterium]